MDHRFITEILFLRYCITQAIFLFSRLITILVLFWSSPFKYVSIEPYTSLDHNFFFFLISNEKKFIKKKLANLSTLGMYCGGKNQEPKLQ